MIKKHQPKARVAAIGDGGNDVAMIQKAHVGIGIEAKEGIHKMIFSTNQLNL